jgi:hypothetical protein
MYMATRNIYVGSSDEPIWSKAEDLAAKLKLSLAQYTTNAVAKYNELKTDEVDAEKIVVDIITPDRDYKKGFMGRWLISPDENVRVADDPYKDAGSAWAVGVTSKGNIAVYHYHSSGTWADLEIFRDFEAATSGDVVKGDMVLPQSVAAQAAQIMGSDFVYMLE